MLNSFQTSGNSPGRVQCRIGLVAFGSAGSALARRLTRPGSISLLDATRIRDRRAHDARPPAPAAPPPLADRVEDGSTRTIIIGLSDQRPVEAA